MIKKKVSVAPQIDQVDPASVKQAITKAKEKKTPQEFVQAYDAFCKQWGYHIEGMPSFKLMADTGTFSIIVQNVVVKDKEA